MKKSIAGKLLSVVMAVTMVLGVVPTQGIGLQVLAQESAGENTLPTSDQGDDLTDDGQGEAPSGGEEKGDPTDDGQGEAPSDEEEKGDPTDDGQGDAPLGEEEKGDPTDEGQGGDPSDGEEKDKPSDKDRGDDTIEGGKKDEPADNGTGEGPLEEGIVSEENQEVGKGFAQPKQTEEKPEFQIEGFLKEGLVYTGKEIIQNIAVLHKGKTLLENVDYIIRYSNNINAAKHNEQQSPALTIVFLGKYEGTRTLYYTIEPRNIAEVSQGYEQAVVMSEEIMIPQPILYYKDRQLVQGRDFQCDYSDIPSEYEVGDTFEYTVKGIGNFTGSLTMDVVVVGDATLDFSEMDVKLETDIYEYNGDAMTADKVKIEYVRVNGTDVPSEYYQCQVQADKPGTGYVYIVPSSDGESLGYHGRKEIKITLVGERNLQDAVLGESWQDSITYSRTKVEVFGGIYQEEARLLIYDGEKLEKDVDYTIQYSNATETGMVTVIFYGKGRYTGTMRNTYAITPSTAVHIEWGENVIQTDDGEKPVAYYQKDGAIPRFQVREDGEYGRVLVKDRDYTVRTKNNEKTGIMLLEIIGKRNYIGYRENVEVQVLKSNLANTVMKVKDQRYGEEWKAPVEIRDTNGRILVPGIDYKFELEYKYGGYTYEDMKTNTAIPEVGTQISVRATGINNYEGSLEGSYRITQWNLKDLEITIDSKEYNGGIVELQESDIHFYDGWSNRTAGNELEMKLITGEPEGTEDGYKIIGYENNSQVGIARVTLQGVGKYGGVRTCHFTIYKYVPKSIKVERVELDETQLVLGAGAVKKLTARVYPENAENKSIIWISSNPEVASVDTEGNVSGSGEGFAVIEAVSQDTGVKAVCNVEVRKIYVENFNLNAAYIEGEIYETYELKTQNIQPENATQLNVFMESSNPDIVSVDASGLLTMHQSGAAVITVSYENCPITQRCVVRVTGGDELGAPSGGDDTELFNEAIRNLESGGTLYVPAGTYKIGFDGQMKGIKLKSNMNLIMHPDTRLEAIATNQGSYDMLYLSELTNVLIHGGQIVGERNNHQGSDGEYGMGISIRDCNGVTISNVKVSDCWGDGIYVGSMNDNDITRGSKNITITDCTLDYNRRNNLSIVNGDYVTVQNCTITNAEGTDPQYGIDIESNNLNNPCENIYISNSTFEGNVGYALGVAIPYYEVMTPNANNIFVSDCTFHGNILNASGTNMEISNSRIYGGIDARRGIIMKDNIIDGGSEEEDLLVASYSANQTGFEFAWDPSKTSNVMKAGIQTSATSPSGKVLRVERTSQGDSEGSYCINFLKMFEKTNAGETNFKPGQAYRFEYTMKGTGKWRVSSHRGGYYDYYPQEDSFTTGHTFFNANSQTANWAKFISFTAVSMDKGMYLEIDSFKIYEVR